MAVAVETRDLCRRFGRRWALAHLDLSVAPGERLLVVGANGSGKTTLLSLLSTLLAPSQGALHIDGVDVSREPERVRGMVGMVSHSPGLYEDLSGRDNLMVQARMLGCPVDLGLLARVGLEDRPDPVRNYSAGMRKRLSFALLLLKGPRLTLLDEPFAQLDPSGMDQVARLIREIPGTVVVASHQVVRASALCDRALVLERGLPRWQGPASQAWDAWRVVYGEGAEAGTDDVPR